MKSTSAKVVLSSDSSISAQISIVQDDAGNQKWTKWGGKLQLAADSGVWIYRSDRPQPDLLFLPASGDRNSWVMVFGDVPANFFGFFCTQTLTGSGCLNDDNLTEIAWAIWTGCV
jgi:hypothetical protein